MDEDRVALLEGRVKEIKVHIEVTENIFETNQYLYNELEHEQEEDRNNLEKLEKRVTNLEDHLRKLQDRAEIIDADSDDDDKRLDGRKSSGS